MARKNPDLFIWLGDNIYADTQDPLVLEQKYAVQLAHPEYQRFKSHIPILGTWDDHDFGLNNSGKENVNKKESQRLFLDFLGEEKNSQRRHQEGIYGSYLIGEGEKSIKIILLDVRYFRDKNNLLGKKQWKWLKRDLKNSKARVHIIASGSAFFLRETFRTEEWSDYPEEKRMLMDLVVKNEVPNPIFISGDLHFAKIFSKEIDPYNRYFTEVMSSGLNSGNRAPAFLIKMLYGAQNTFVGNNFGQIEVNWEKKQVDLSIFSSNDGEQKAYHQIQLK